LALLKRWAASPNSKSRKVAVKCFIRFVLAKAAVSYGLDLMMAIFRIAQGGISTALSASGLATASATVLPAEIVTISRGRFF
jgi:hypothetical protein